MTPGSRALSARVRRLIDPKQLALARLGVHPRRGALGVGHGEEVEDQGQVLGEALVEQHELAGDPLARRLVGVPLGDLEVRAQELEHGQERDGLGVRLAGDVVDGHRPSPAALRELVAETALADAGLADDPDHLPAGRRSACSRALSSTPSSLVAPDEAREAARA